MTVFIAAIPIAGIAAMKKITVTFARAIGFPSWPVSFTRTMLLPFNQARSWHLPHLRRLPFHTTVALERSPVELLSHSHTDSQGYTWTPDSRCLWRFRESYRI